MTLGGRGEACEGQRAAALSPMKHELGVSFYMQVCVSSCAERMSLDSAVRCCALELTETLSLSCVQHVLGALRAQHAGRGPGLWCSLAWQLWPGEQCHGVRRTWCSRTFVLGGSR